jgi:acylphosphatase
MIRAADTLRRVTVRYDITFTGRVQGVGFRYTTERTARQFPGITGWVRNERDGSVRCIVEGPKDQLDAFVAAVQKAMDGFIAETRVAQSPGTREFDRFEVRH